MQKGDLDYRVMESLDAPIGNSVPILQYRANRLQNVDELHPNFQRITDDIKAFSEVYKRVRDLYARFQELNENTREQHGKSTIETFWQKLLEMEKLKRILEDSVEKKDARKIKELASILYKSVCDLLSLSRDFGNLPFYREYRRIKYAH